MENIWLKSIFLFVYTYLANKADSEKQIQQNKWQAKMCSIQRLNLWYFPTTNICECAYMMYLFKKRDILISEISVCCMYIHMMNKLLVNQEVNWLLITVVVCHNRNCSFQKPLNSETKISTFFSLERPFKRNKNMRKFELGYVICQQKEYTLVIGPRQEVGHHGKQSDELDVSSTLRLPAEPRYWWW